MLSRFHREVRYAILSERVPIRYDHITDNPYYYARLSVDLGGPSFRISVAENYAVCLNDIFRGLFDDEVYFQQLKSVVDKHIKPLSAEDVVEIENLRKRIREIYKSKKVGD